MTSTGSHRLLIHKQKKKKKKRFEKIIGTLTKEKETALLARSWTGSRIVEYRRIVQQQINIYFHWAHSTLSGWGGHVGGGVLRYKKDKPKATPSS